MNMSALLVLPKEINLAAPQQPSRVTVLCFARFGCFPVRQRFDAQVDQVESHTTADLRCSTKPVHGSTVRLSVV